MSNAIDLTARVTSDTSDAVSGFDKVASSAKSMGDAVDQASKKTDTATDRMARTAEAADNLDSKSAQATGSLGALSSGFELVGADKYATGLQSAALATDFLAGVGEGLNLIMELQSVQFAKAKIQAAALAVQEKVTAAASRVWAAAQWALNAAMEANPIGLIVIAVVALIAGFVLLYKKSDRFRAIVDRIGQVGRAAFGLIEKALGKVKNIASSTFDWIRSHWRLLAAILLGPFGLLVAGVTKYWSRIRAGVGAVIDWIRSHWRLLVAILTGPFGVAVATIIKNWDKIKAGVQAVVDKVRDLIGWVKDIKVPDALSDPFDTMADAVNDVIDAVRSLIDWIGKIHIPDLNPLNHIPGLGRINPLGYVPRPTTARGLVGGPAGRVVSTGGGVVININVDGGLNDYQTGARIAGVLARYGFITAKATP